MDIWEKLKTKTITQEDRDRLEQIVIDVICTLTNFLVSLPHKQYAPKKILSQIDEFREFLKTDFILPPGRKKEIEKYLDFIETKTRSAVLICCNEDRKDLHHVLKQFDRDDKPSTANFLFDSSRMEEFHKADLAYLRELSAKEPKFQDVIKRPLGEKGRRKADKLEPSHKNWPVVSWAIYGIYKLLFPMYLTKHRKGSRRAVGNAEYPKELLEDIVELLKTEFHDIFKDLTVNDVRSRIQYQKRVEAKKDKGKSQRDRT